MKKKTEEANILVLPGAGGIEAKDWAAMLTRMYTCWACQNGHAASSWSHHGMTGITIHGVGVLRALKGERGVHRLCRISPFDPQKRRHTSFAAVEVYGKKFDVFEDSAAFENHLNWAGCIRSYVFHPSYFVKDIATGETTNLDVLNGDLSAFIKEKSRK